MDRILILSFCRIWKDSSKGHDFHIDINTITPNIIDSDDVTASYIYLSLLSVYFS